MASIVATVSQFLPPVVLTLFKLGVGLVFPLAVGAFALLDVGALVDEVLHTTAHMNERASRVQVAEQHAALWMKKQKESTKELEAEYEQMAKADARNMVNRVKQGDYSFGINDVQKGVAPTSATRVSIQPQFPQSTTMPQLPQGGMINGQSFPAGLPTGTTQQINIPPSQNPLQAKPGLLNSINSFFGPKQ